MTGAEATGSEEAREGATRGSGKKTRVCCSGAALAPTSYLHVPSSLTCLPNWAEVQANLVTHMLLKHQIIPALMLNF